MSFELPDDADFDSVEKAYYRGLRRKHKKLTAIAKAARKSRATIRRKFTGWGWDLDWVERADPAAAPPRAAPPALAPPSAAPPTPNRNKSHDLLEPDVRAKLEALKKKKR